MDIAYHKGFSKSFILYLTLQAATKTVYFSKMRIVSSDLSIRNSTQGLVILVRSHVTSKSFTTIGSSKIDFEIEIFILKKHFIRT